MTVCKMADCDRPVRCRGVCEMHYQRWRKHGSPEWEPPRQMTPYERVMSRVTARPAPYDGLSPCWIFTGSLNHHGYGNVAVKAGGVWAPQRAHRVVLEHHAGPCPEGGVSMHLCDERACVNPEHLRWGTHQENTDDMLRKGRAKVPGLGKPLQGVVH